MNLVLIGNSPSSGSTFLSDLLDSTGISACGEETGIFSNKHLYNFERFKKQPRLTSNIQSIYFYRTNLYDKDFHYYAMNMPDFYRMINGSTDFNDFCRQFSIRLLTLRGKDLNGIVFEKTPGNTNCLSEFLNSDVNAQFIFLVRNPIYVYRSLLKRGFSDTVSLITWFIEAAKCYKYRNDERILILKYEDLVDNPFKITSDIINKYTGTRIQEEEIEYNFRNNKYNELFKIDKISSWQNKEHGKVFNANSVEMEKDLIEKFSRINYLKINSHYAELYDLADVNFDKLVNYFGYQDDLSKIVKPSPNNKLELGWRDKYFFYKKWKSNFKEGESTLSELGTYLTPVSHV